MGYEVPGARPARRPRRMRGVLSLAAAGLFVCCVGAAGLGAWNYQQVRQSSGGARDAAEAFLRDVTSGDAAGAYDKLCGDTRERWSRDDFVQRLSVPPTINRYAIDDVAVATDRGQVRGTVTARLTRRSGAVDVREMPMVKDGDRWQVCGDPF
ncbi:Rv0361 family membrane protein [Plantactinospora soyae]|uniref:DUF4878 domain-containing protein n=1 Tax=Plantactinospora soyae TaxID=1544732 RepID=A0A927MB43_9ACTN|nr:DUF4878 domain-containing protein [Plantactinospora soyae]MBE1490452.1 hypothetical protein [Plantactinospora soyae]